MCDMTSCPAVDEAAIRNTIALISMLADDGDTERYASLFTEDAYWEVHNLSGVISPPPPLKGRQAIKEGAQQRQQMGTQGPDSNTRHGILTSVVELRGDDASARSYVAFYRDVNSCPTIAVFCIYEDRYRRTGDGWKLAERHIYPG